MGSQKTPGAISCRACHAAHEECDGRTPVCGVCIAKNRQCVFKSATPGGPKQAPGSACLLCRQKKRKCDGIKPTCGPCEKRNIECVYGSSLKRPRTVNSHKVSSSFEKRPRSSPSPLTTVERGKRKSQSAERKDKATPRIVAGSLVASVRAATPLNSGNDSRNCKLQKDNVNLQKQDINKPALSSCQPKLDAFFTPQVQTTRKQEKQDMSSSCVQIRHLEDDTMPDGNEDQKVKSTSFMAGLKQAILHRIDMSKPGFGPESRQELERLGNVRKNKARLKTIEPDEKDLVLPAQELSDRLVSEYLTIEYVNLPIFHLSSFQSKYRALWSGEEDAIEDMGVFRATLNVIFALVSLTLRPNHQSDATMYFIRAQNLLRLGSLGGDDIGYVQAYILASQYLMAVDNVKAAWQSIGMAIHIAQSLHLHLGSGSRHLTQRHARELARRLWHSCIIMERSIAMSMGFSAQITPNTSNAPLPTPLEHEYIDVLFGGNPMPGVDRPSIIEFFTALSRLYERYDDIVAVHEEFRLVGGRCPQKVIECFDGQTILKVDRLLFNWRASLSAYLLFDNDNHPSLKGPIARRQHNILRVRYLYMSLLVWRPCLALIASCPEIGSQRSGKGDQAGIHHSVDTRLAYTVIRECAIKCILAACELVELITNGEAQPQEPISPWWENIGYAFACANVFVAAHLSPRNINEELSGTDVVDKRWRQSIRLLENYRTFSSVAGKCISALEDITETVLGDEGQEGDGGDGLKSQPVRDMTWIECLPIDLAD